MNPSLALTSNMEAEMFEASLFSSWMGQCHSGTEDSKEVQSSGSEVAGETRHEVGENPSPIRLQGEGYKPQAQRAGLKGTLADIAWLISRHLETD